MMITAIVIAAVLVLFFATLLLGIMRSSADREREAERIERNELMRSSGVIQPASKPVQTDHLT